MTLHPQLAKRWFGAVVLCMMFAAGAVTAAEPRGLPFVTASGETGLGRLRGIDAQWQVTLEQAETVRTFAPHELVRWGQWRERADGMAIVLSDGSVLQVEDWRFDGDHVVVPESPTGIWRPTRWPRSAVRGLIFQWPGAAIERDRLVARLLSASSRHDEVWLEGGDRLQGSLQMSPPADADAAPGTPADDANQNRWSVRTRAGDIPVARENIVALALPGNREEPTQPSNTVVAWLATRDGSCLRVTSLSLRDDLVELELAGGLRLACDAATLWNELRFVQPQHDRLKYVSDLEPLGYKHLPFLSQSWDWSRDRCVAGGLLRSGGAVYRKGLGMHSSSRLAYELGEGYEWFCAELAIDQQAGRRGSVLFRVYTDAGDGQWRAIYESPVVRGGAAPLPVRIDLRGARRMALIVDFADRGDELDYADWLDARLIPAAKEPRP